MLYSTIKIYSLKDGKQVFLKETEMVYINPLSNKIKIKYLDENNYIQMKELELNKYEIFVY